MLCIKFQVGLSNFLLSIRATAKILFRRLRKIAKSRLKIMKLKNLLIMLILITVTNFITFGVTKSLLGLSNENEWKNAKLFTNSDENLNDSVKAPVFGIICIFVIVFSIMCLIVSNIDRSW